MDRLFNRIAQTMQTRHNHRHRVNEAAGPTSPSTSAAAVTPMPLVAQEPTSASHHSMRTQPVSTERSKNNAAQVIDSELAIRSLRASSPTHAWLENKYALGAPVNIDNLLRIDGEVTRYGEVNIEGHKFIIGPRPTGTELGTPGEQADIYQRLIDSYPEIGAIFSVDADKPGHSATNPGYANLKTYRSAKDMDKVASEISEKHIEYILSSSLNQQQDIVHQQFYGFPAEGNISQEAHWVAGRGIARFMQAHPEKIALICSDGGLSRPCLVAASAVMQLEEQKYVEQKYTTHNEAWNQHFSDLTKSLEKQRCKQSSAHLKVSKNNFSANLSNIERLNFIRTRGNYDDQIGDIVPQILPQTTLLNGRGIVFQNADGQLMHRYTATTEEHGVHIQPQDDDIHLYHLHTEHGPHYEVAHTLGGPWNREYAINRDGDCLFRALHRALLPASPERDASEEGAIQQYRDGVANYLADHVRILNNYVATTEQQVVEGEWGSEELPKNIAVNNIARPQRSEYSRVGVQRVHTNPFTQEPIDPQASDSIRLISRDLNTGRLYTDDKYFKKEDIAKHHKNELHDKQLSGFVDDIPYMVNARNQMASPTTNQPVIGFIDHRGKIQHIEMLLGSEKYYIVTSPTTTHQGTTIAPQVFTRTLPVLSTAHRQISHITDSHGCIIGGDQDGKKVYLDEQNKEPARNAVFFKSAENIDKKTSDTKPRVGLVCYTDAKTSASMIKEVKETVAHRNSETAYGVAFVEQETHKNDSPEKELRSTIKEKYSPLHGLSDVQHHAVEKRKREIQRLALRQAMFAPPSATAHHTEPAYAEIAHRTVPEANIASGHAQRPRPTVAQASCATEANTRSIQQRKDDPDADGNPGPSGIRNAERIPSQLQSPISQQQTTWHNSQQSGTSQQRQAMPPTHIPLAHNKTLSSQSQRTQLAQERVKAHHVLNKQSADTSSATTSNTPTSVNNVEVTSIRQENNVSIAALQKKIERLESERVHLLKEKDAAQQRSVEMFNATRSTLPEKAEKIKDRQTEHSKTTKIVSRREALPSS